MNSLLNMRLRKNTSCGFINLKISFQINVPVRFHALIDFDQIECRLIYSIHLLIEVHLIRIEAAGSVINS